jgi:23S rRNA (adenine2503-C2)-methyltransferase
VPRVPPQAQADGVRRVRGSEPGAIRAFRDELQRGGLRATIRLTRGQDIDAACGQLAARSPGS